MEQRCAPREEPLGQYFLARLERLLRLPTREIAARGEQGLGLVLWALRSTFHDCLALGRGTEAVLLLAYASEAAADGSPPLTRPE
ncbi:MAG TPA: hypothetical protein VFB73_00125 [Chloroflexota bacterium]|nr:hypothetical protein [Chloroflexota bacterium]